MPKLQEVGAVIVDLRNQSIAAKAKGGYFMDGFAEVNVMVDITTVLMTKLARGDIKGFVRHLQKQSGPHPDTFDFIVSTLFEKLEVAGTCDDGYGHMLPCWEDFEEQFLK